MSIVTEENKYIKTNISFTLLLTDGFVNTTISFVPICSQDLEWLVSISFQ